MTLIPDLPKAAGPLMTRLKDTHDLVQMTPNANAALAYEVVIPKGWEAVQALGPSPEGFAQPSPIGLFLSDRGPRPASVSVTVTQLPVEVNLEDWVLTIAGEDGWTVFASEWHRTPSGRVVDVGSTKPSGSGVERQVMRTMALANNGRIFMVSGVALEADWNRWKHVLLIACSSFKLLNPVKSDLLEPLLEWEGGEPRFGLAFPGSWGLVEKPPEVPGKSAVDIRLAEDDTLLAYLRVKATDLLVHQPSRTAYLKQADDELEKAGFTRTGMRIWPADDPLGKLVGGYQGTAIVPGRLGGREVEARLGFRIGERLGLSFTLLSVPQRVNPLLWMRGKRAFELVRELCWASPARREAPPAMKEG